VDKAAVPGGRLGGRLMWRLLLRSAQAVKILED